MSQAQELAALEKIAKLLESQGQPEAPEFGPENDQENKNEESFDVDPALIASSQQQAQQTEQQLISLNAIMEEVLVEIRNISATITQGLS
jgi:hypothetical protein